MDIDHMRSDWMQENDFYKDFLFLMSDVCFERVLFYYAAKSLSLITIRHPCKKA